MRASKGPKRTFRGDLQRLRKKATGLGGGRDDAKAKAGSALVVVREFLVNAATLLWGLAVGGARLARRVAVGAARGAAGIATGVAAVVAGGGKRAAGLVRRLVVAGSGLVTPKRTLTAVTLAAAILLAVSQFTDYTGVRIGTPQYAGLEHEAPAPLVQSSTAGSAHGWVLLAIALVAAVALVLALRGRWRMARLVSLAGLAGLAVALIVDMPKGLDEGSAAVNFEGAKATLLAGFYVEVAAAAVLTLCGVLLARQLSATAPRRSRRRPRVRTKPLGVAGSGT